MLRPEDRVNKCLLVEPTAEVNAIGLERIPFKVGRRRGGKTELGEYEQGDYISKLYSEVSRLRIQSI